MEYGLTFITNFPLVLYVELELHYMLDACSLLYSVPGDLC